MRRLLILLPAALTLAACGGGGGGGSNESEQGSGGAASQTVQISEKEFSLTPSSATVTKAGTVEFQVTNNGKIAHALEIEGNGVEEKTEDIEPGQSATLRVDLSKDGSYELYCPIDGHKDQGMKGTLTVGTGPAGTMTTGTTTSSGPGY